MSYSHLVRVYKTKVVHFHSYPNSWGTAPAIWDFLANEYLGWEHTLGRTDSDIEKLWNLQHDTSIPMHLRMCLGMTFDFAFAPHNALAELADHIDAAGRDIARKWPDRVNHWPLIAIDLRTQATIKQDHRLRGIALECTSVSDIWAGASKDILADLPFDFFEHITSYPEAA